MNKNTIYVLSCDGNDVTLCYMQGLVIPQGDWTLIEVMQNEYIRYDTTKFIVHATYDRTHWFDLSLTNELFNRCDGLLETWTTQHAGIHIAHFLFLRVCLRARMCIV